MNLGDLLKKLFSSANATPPAMRGDFVARMEPKARLRASSTRYGVMRGGLAAWSKLPQD
jgi:hypothetical protein